MKKLSFVFAFAAMNLVSSGAFAQEEVTQVAVEIAQEEIEIQVSELPETIIDALTADFSDYTTDKAFKTIKDEQVVYWVVLSKEDANIKVLFNAEGIVIEQKNGEQ